MIVAWDNSNPKTIQVICVFNLYTHARMHMHMHTRTHTRTHTYTQTAVWFIHHHSGFPYNQLTVRLGDRMGGRERNEEGR